MENKVLAVVAGMEITEAEFESFLGNLPREQQAYLNNPQARAHYLDQLVAMYLFAKEGEALKLDETEEFQKILANAKRDILAQMMMGETMKNINVDEEEMKAYYEANSQQFTKGETVSAKHILTETEERCNEILAEIESGSKTFEEAAKEYSTCPSGQRGGDLGQFGRGQMVKEFEDAAFTGEIGKVIGPVTTQFGSHLILVESRSEKTVASYEEVKETIRRNLISRKQNVAYNDKVQELRAKYEVK